MTRVLERLGYSPLSTTEPRTVYAGMEIDISGRTKLTDVPFYSECKCYKSSVSADEVHEFAGKYFAKWLQDQRSQGLFLALPGLTPDARGYMAEYFSQSPSVTFLALEEEQVVQAIIDGRMTCDPSVVTSQVGALGIAGDSILLFTDDGFVWLQLVISPGKTTPDKVAAFDSQGTPLDLDETESIVSRVDEARGFGVVTLSAGAESLDASAVADQVVEVRGGSSCFEYQFPAPPAHFIGRADARDEIASFLASVAAGQSASRGLLLQGASGIGKSSLALSVIDAARTQGMEAFAIDCRTATRPRFVLDVVSYVFSHIQQARPGIAQNITISGFEGAPLALELLGKQLREQGSMLFVLLDQFENLFFMPDVLAPIHNLYLKLTDLGTNCVFGFSWKSDLLCLPDSFPFRMQESFLRTCHRVDLQLFGEDDSNAMLDALSRELGHPLRQDLRFLLSEYSQGLPWLLKKLCSHVMQQVAERVSQKSIASLVLNVEELFLQDLEPLSAEQLSLLNETARRAPVEVLELGEEVDAAVLQSLVDRRLIVRVGTKVDIYWDIFRDYLNSGTVPVQENYLLRAEVNSVVHILKALRELDGMSTPEGLQTEAELSEGSYYNLMKDMRLLRLATVEEGVITPLIPLNKDDAVFESDFRRHIAERLSHNRLACSVLEALSENRFLTLEDIARLLHSKAPYVPASEKTWEAYAHTMTRWMDAANLAVLDRRSGVLDAVESGSAVVTRRNIMAKRGATFLPAVQYSALEQVACLIWDAVEKRAPLDFSSVARSSVNKAMLNLEQLGFIERRPQNILVKSRLIRFVQHPEERVAIFAESLEGMPAFGTFLSILEEKASVGATTEQLADELRSRLGFDWSAITSASQSKLMMNWARHAGLAPSPFDRSAKGKRGFAPRVDPLFPIQGEEDG